MNEAHRLGYERVADAHRKRRVARWASFEAEAVALWPSYSVRPRFMFGLALYAGEGGKTGNDINVSNCDPRILRASLEFFLMLGARREDVRVSIHLHDAARVSEVESFWSSELELPLEQFTRTVVAVSRASKQRRGNVQPNGTCRVRVHSTRLLRMITKWMDMALDVRTES